MSDVQAVVDAIKSDLGNPESWGAAVEFRNSLALCALNSGYSLRGGSPAAKNVLARYRSLRPTADSDSGPDLISAMDEAGGPERFASEVLRNRTVLPGTSRVRTVGIYEALTRLAALEPSVETAAQLRAGVNGDRTEAKRAWVSVSGLGDQSWSYLLMNAGVDTETKPDVMVRRYLTRSLQASQDIGPARARELLTAAAAQEGVSIRALDRAIWLYESPNAD